MSGTIQIWLLVLCFSPVAVAQNFTDNFDDTPADDFAASSDDWDAVWSGDGWSTTLNSGGVAPNTDVNGPGEFGDPADAFENAIVVGEATWRDYGVEIRFMIDDNDALGLVFRYSSPDDFYLLVMTRNEMPGLKGQVDNLAGPQTRLYRIFEGVAERLEDPEVNLAYIYNTNIFQQLRVEVAASTITAWIETGDDGVDTSEDPLLVVEDPGPGPGTGLAGIYAFSMGEGVPGTYFDYFEVRPMDSDQDGRTNDDETAAGTDPFDADSDDDGLPDGSELDWLGDEDSDKIINALDWDADGDGLADGLENGVVKPGEDTDIEAGYFTPDADPHTTTDHLAPDSDNGGVSDGDEDSNKNGAFEPELGETDPNNPNDDYYEPGDGGPDADTDTDTDGDTDTDADTDADDAGTDTDTEDSGFGSLYGGPACDCSTVGQESLTSLSLLQQIWIVLGTQWTLKS